MMELPQGQVRIEALGDELVLHTYLSNGLGSGSGSVTTLVFESGDNLLVFDTQFYKPFAEEAKAYIESLGKPVDKLIISHGPPRPWFRLRLHERPGRALGHRQRHRGIEAIVSVLRGNPEAEHGR